MAVSLPPTVAPPAGAATIALGDLAERLAAPASRPPLLPSPFMWQQQQQQQGKRNGLVQLVPTPATQPAEPGAAAAVPAGPSLLDGAPIELDLSLSQALKHARAGPATPLLSSSARLPQTSSSGSGGRASSGRTSDPATATADSASAGAGGAANGSASSSAGGAAAGLSKGVATQRSTGGSSGGRGGGGSSSSSGGSGGTGRGSSGGSSGQPLEAPLEEGEWQLDPETIRLCTRESGSLVELGRGAFGSVSAGAGWGWAGCRRGGQGRGLPRQADIES